MATKPEDKLRRAGELRRMAAKAKNPTAKDSFNRAADRLERNAARQANSVGRRPRLARGVRGGAGLVALQGPPVSLVKQGAPTATAPVTVTDDAIIQPDAPDDAA